MSEDTTLLSVKELARRWDVSEQMLRNTRSLSDGRKPIPSFIHNGHVRYRLSDVIAHERAKLRYHAAAMQRLVTTA